MNELRHSAKISISPRLTPTTVFKLNLGTAWHDLSIISWEQVTNSQQTSKGGNQRHPDTKVPKTEVPENLSSAWNVKPHLNTQWYAHTGGESEKAILSLHAAQQYAYMFFFLFEPNFISLGLYKRLELYILQKAMIFSRSNRKKSGKNLICVWIADYGYQISGLYQVGHLATTPGLPGVISIYSP